MAQTNKIGIDNNEKTDINAVQANVSSGQSQKRKLMWITFSIIIIVGLIIIIPMIILKKNKTNTGSILVTKEVLSTTKLMILETRKTTKKAQSLPSSPININSRWNQHASTVAGGNGEGNELDQLNSPFTIYLDEDNQSIYITDTGNHRIVRWKFGALNGEVVAGGNGNGKRIDQLNKPTDVILDKKNNSLIICDHNNRRVVRWTLDNDTKQYIIMYQFSCYGLAMDNNGDLYVSDHENNKIVHWKQGNTFVTIVAGKNGRGNCSNQLSGPRYIFVDEEYSIYIVDFFNDRVMKWKKNAKEGVVVARVHKSASNPDYPVRIQAITVDHMGNIYMSTMFTCRITRQLSGIIKNFIIIGGDYCQGVNTELYSPIGLSFDRKGNLYVVDINKHRIQKYNIDSD